MPPRAARAPKKDSVAVAVKKNLSAAPASRANKKEIAAAAAAAPAVTNGTRSRVSRRKQNVVPQEAPEWQQQALKTAAASARLQKKQNGSAVRASGARAGAGEGKSAAKTKTSTAKKGKRAKGNDEDARQSGTSDNEEAASAASDSDSEGEAGSARGRGTKKTAAKRPRKSAGSTSEDGAPKKRAQKLKVAELQCLRCKLRVDQWPFCGLSGEPHVTPGESVAETEAAAASTAPVA